MIGRPDAPLNSRSTNSFGGVARIDFDVAANEAYVADGYFHRRVVVIDMTSGAVKRFWGAYGNQPDDAEIGPYDPAAPPAQQFRTVTCAVPSNDGFVYVCDRGNNRIQVFRKDGTFVSEKIIAPNTRGAVGNGVTRDQGTLSRDRGSVWDIALSHDPGQRFLYVADGMNERVYIVERASMEVRTSFGVGGRYPSHFLAVGSIAVDSRGNIYTGEDEEGKRVQKFNFIGMGPVTAQHQGAVWPTTASNP
jgi:DNA-binding beta-propeller fold protein YncE